MPAPKRRPKVESRPQVVDVLSQDPDGSVLETFQPTLPDSLTLPAETHPDVEPGISTTTTSIRPVPDSELTPEQLRIRELENMLALERGKKDVEPEFEAPAVPGNPDNILIHFLEDGFTALGQVWFRGQELEFEPNSAAYRDTCDRNGWSWLELRNDEFAQADRWGRIMFRNGPWPGKPYQAAAKLTWKAGNTSVEPPTESELAKADAAERRRRRAAPRLPVH